MRRIITGHDAQGRSCVVSSEEIAEGQVVDVHLYRPGDVADLIAAIPAGTAAEVVEPPAGAVRVAMAVFPPASEAPPPDPGLPGFDEHGFHTTRTIDVVWVARGVLTLLLDEEEVVVRHGDVVIQQPVRHAWRNDGDEPAQLLAVLHAPAELER